MKLSDDELELLFDQSLALVNRIREAIRNAQKEPVKYAYKLIRLTQVLNRAKARKSRRFGLYYFGENE